MTVLSETVLGDSIIHRAKKSRSLQPIPAGSHNVRVPGRGMGSREMTFEMTTWIGKTNVLLSQAKTQVRKNEGEMLSVLAFSYARFFVRQITQEKE